MPVSLSLADLPKHVLREINKGVLDDDVLVQFICNTGSGGVHDPDARPDDRVRPSHAAFHGKIFKLSEAPVPPLDYGCRCAIHYLAAEGSPAAEIVEDTTDEKPTTTVAATKAWLEDNVTDWKKVATAVSDANAKDALADGIKRAKASDIDNPRMIVEMVLDVLKGNRHGKR